MNSSSASNLPLRSNSRTSTGFSSQQPTLVGNTTNQRNDAFQNAFDEFTSRFSDQEKNDFKATTYEKLQNEILRLQQTQENNLENMNMSRIKSFLEAMNEFGKTIEVFLNTSNLLAFIWGPMKFLILTASNFSEAFDTLLDAYKQIGEQLPFLKDYENLFGENAHMLEVLKSMYLDILEFHQIALKFFSGKLWRKFFRVMWKDFKTKFDGILKTLQRRKNMVECRATISQYQKYREDMIDLRKTIQDAISQEQMKTLTAVKEWLAVGYRPQLDHEANQRIRNEFPNTGRWIAKHTDVQEWLNADIPATPVIWMCGIPGAGKTILASNIIDECKRKDGFKTSYFYCHHDDPAANTNVGVMRGLIDQLLDEYPELLPHCRARQASSGEPSLQSPRLAERLLADFCATVPKLFLVIDGIDECEPIYRKQLLEVLIKIVSEADIDEAGKLRLLLVSQKFPDIRAALHNQNAVSRVQPKTISLLSSDNNVDIQIFVKAWVDRIAKKHAPFEEDWATYLRNLTISRANGMFLYAKLVMENLYNQPTRGDLMAGISKENFPNGIKEAYERILTSIKKASKNKSQEEWQIATKLLGWMVCCQRQLTLKEIQVALSIDENIIDWVDRHLRGHIDDIWGSLVKVNGDRVALVHGTARHYIIQCTEEIHIPSVECELATLCLRYLVFPCFEVDDDDVDEQRLREWMLDGHFAFQDYAIAKWFHHVDAFVTTAKDLLKDERRDLHNHLAEISCAIDNFLACYDEEDFHQDIVPQCRSKCEVFQNQDFYDEIVALTSHIFKFQKFGAKHKVSIPKLEKALIRNRTFMEKHTPTPGTDEYDRFCRFYNDERQYKCTRITCMYFSEGFKEARARKRHVEIHDRPFQCDVPDCLGANGFTNGRDLEKHKRAFHPDISELGTRFREVAATKAKADHPCPICGKSYTRKQIQVDHVRSHKGERPHECPECGKSFTRKNDMTRHRRLHSRK